MTVLILSAHLLFLYILGGTGVIIHNRKQEKDRQKRAWIKYMVYFLIVNTLFSSIVYSPFLFRILCVLIILGGMVELVRLQYGIRKIAAAKFITFVLAYLLIAILFVCFSSEQQDLLLFTLLIVCSFDAFSQLAGQLFGKRRICPHISPNKTIGGTIGGTLISAISGIVVGCGMDWPISRSLCLGLGIAAAAFSGDLAASYMKRQYGVKDFSRVFPEHGGILDRFDSLLLAGAFVYLFQSFSRM
jgi:phosphatidate cytidylyltransferase